MLEKPPQNIISQNLFPDHHLDPYQAIECLLYFAKSSGDYELLALSVLQANLANCIIFYNLNA